MPIPFNPQVATPASDSHAKAFKPRPAFTRFQDRFANVIFDLGDVLFTWSPPSESPVSGRVMKGILRSATWCEYEKGRLTESEAFSLFSKEFDADKDDLLDTFALARRSLELRTEFLDVIMLLKANGVRLFAMSNISAPDWDYLHEKEPQIWNSFERVFTSCAAKQRKPNLGFYEHVIRETTIDPRKTVFVDDKLENVVSARSFGMHGIVFDSSAQVIRQIKRLCLTPTALAWSYLKAHPAPLSYTNTGVSFMDNFSQLLILEATNDPSLVRHTASDGQWNFFQLGGQGILTSSEWYPNDLDTTSLGLTISHDIPEEVKHRVMNEMLDCRNEDDIISVYFSKERPRLDPIVCINVLTLFYQNGRGHELHKTLSWVRNVLTNRAYLDGTLYYSSAECFLYFMSRLIASSPDVARFLREEFITAIQEQFGHPGNSTTLSLRILAAANVGLVNEPDILALISQQEDNGSFGGFLARYGATGILIGNDSVATAFAWKALKEADRLRNKLGLDVHHLKHGEPFKFYAKNGIARALTC